MKVKALIHALQKMDPELDVYCYDETSEEWCGGKMNIEEMNEFPYVKADPPFRS